MGEFRSKDIIDDIEQRIKQQKIIDDEKAAKDMTYDEFLDKYCEHIEGKGDGDDRRPFTAEGAESKEDGKGRQGGTFDSLQQEENKLEDAANTSMDKGFETVNKSRQEVKEINKSKESILSNQDYKLEIPDSCMMHIMKGCRIEKLHKKYVLLVHPFPLMEGEMILFQPLKAD